METLSEVIKSLRDIGLTQSEVSSALGLTQAHVSNVEKGKRGARTPAETLLRAYQARDEIVRKHAAEAAEQQ